MDYDKLLNYLERKTADTHELQAASAITVLRQRVAEFEKERLEQQEKLCGCIVNLGQLRAERDVLKQQRYDLVAALEPFVKYNSSKPVIDLAIRTSDITKARAAIASVKEKA